MAKDDDGVCTSTIASPPGIFDIVGYFYWMGGFLT